MTTFHQTAGPRLGIAGLALLLGLGFLTSCGDDDKGSGDAGASSSGGGRGTAEQEGSDEDAGTDKGDEGADAADSESGDDDDTAGGTGSSDDAGDTGADDGDEADDDADGGDAPDAAEDPHSPFVVAAAAVGTRSRDSVVTLHALGVSTTSESGVPHDLLPDQGKKLRGALRDQVVEASRLTPPRGSAAARLVTSLNAYSRAAGQLAKWAPDGGPLPRVWFHRLGRADQTWLKALRDLSDEAGQDLLQDLPELLMPSA